MAASQKDLLQLVPGTGSDWKESKFFKCSHPETLQLVPGTGSGWKMFGGLALQLVPGAGSDWKFKMLLHEARSDWKVKYERV